MYEIYMYNTWFGDCFRLSNRNKHLFVDFGIHRNSKVIVAGAFSSSRRRDVVHNTIADEIVKLSGTKNLLITHYHEDHISGLLYMKEASYVSPIFNTVYLPDIWSFPSAKNIVTLLLLENLLDYYEVGRFSLLEFVRFLCTGVKNVELLHRGKVFDDKNFVALWPDPDIVGKSAKLLLEKLELGFADALTELAEQLIDVVLDLSFREQNDELKEHNLGKIENLEVRLKNINLEVWLSKIPVHGENRKKIKDFGNEISIVFQNWRRSNKNMLFTGDLNSKYLSMIAKNYHKRVRMHKTYKYIKIPHHGTVGSAKSHYFDFLQYKPKILMFPSGKCRGDSYKICEEYKDVITTMAATGRIKVYCSNSNWCKMNATGKHSDCKCGTKYTNIIFPKVLIKVR